MVNDKLNNKLLENCHFFVNSVKFIGSVLKKTGINPDDVRIVCADNESNRLKIEGYNIGKPSDEARKINFYTSTCFEGCDIFDENGKTFVVSEGRNTNTLYDISTMFTQIIGRIRDSKYRNRITHIVSNTNYKGNVTCDEFKQIAEAEYKVSESAISEYNNQEKHLRKQRYEQWGKDHFIDRFIYVDVDKDYNFSMDRNLLKKNLLDYEIKTEVYNKSYSLVKAYKENDFNVESLMFKSYSDKLAANDATKGTFKEAVEEYHSIRSTMRWGNGKERLALLELKYDYLKDAYSLVGMERIRELKYNVTLVKREIIKNSVKHLSKKIIELMVQKIGYQNPVDLEFAKKKLQEVYDILSLEITATASKLNDYFIVKIKPKIIAGQSVKQIELVREKTLLE